MKKEHTRLLRRISAVLLIILTFTVCATGCELEDVLNSVVKAKDEPTCVGKHNSFHCAYKSNKTEFDINDVTLEFFYGTYVYTDVEFMREHGSTVPGFELYFSNDQEQEYLIKRVEEDLVSEKYHSEYNKDEKRYDFTHSETITIPKELFTKEKGYVYFFLREISNADNYPTKFSLTSVDIYYEVIGDKVIISETYNESF